MNKRDEALSHLLAGKTPSEIATAMKVTIGTVMPYLYQKVGEGKLCRSEILFSIPAAARRTIEKAIAKHGTRNVGMITRALNKAGQKVAKEDVEIYLKLRKERITLGDLYDTIRDIEVVLHSAAKAKLIALHGEKLWWRNAIPIAIRTKCAEAFEKDEDNPADHPSCYTYLLDLVEIYKKNWTVLAELLPNEFRTDRPKFEKAMKKLNSIRNVVMHPVKKIVPTEEDYRFVQHFFRVIDGKATGVLLAQQTLQAMTTGAMIQ
jgi:hypothetical protein